jgi:hypothetical protein
MSGNAVVSGNGTGVLVFYTTSFTKTGGIIYGKEADPTLRNGDYAVYADSTHYRENTVSAEQNMSKNGTTYEGQWTD